MDISSLLADFETDTTFMPTLLKQEFNALQFKLIAVYLSLAHNDLTQFEPILFRTGELADLGNLKDRKNLSVHLDKQAELLQMQIKLASSGGFEYISAFYTRRYDAAKASFTFQADPRLTYLYSTEASQFQAEQLYSDMVLLHDKASIRFAIALHVLLGQQPHKELCFSIDEFRQLMLHQYKDSKYQRFAHFNDRVVQKVIAQLNQHTSLWVECHQLPANRRKVTHLSFLVRRKTRRDKHALLIKDVKQDAVADLLVQFGVNPVTAGKRVKALREKHQDDELISFYISEAIRYTRSKTLRDKASYVPYLLKTLEMNYHHFNWQAQQRKRVAGIEQSRAQYEHRQQSLANQLAHWREESQQAQLLEWFECLDKTHQSHLLAQANQYVKREKGEHIFGDITAGNLSGMPHIGYFEDYVLETGIITPDRFQLSESQFHEFCLTRGYPYLELVQEQARIESRLEAVSLAS